MGRFKTNEMRQAKKMRRLKEAIQKAAALKLKKIQEKALKEKEDEALPK